MTSECAGTLQRSDGALWRLPFILRRTLAWLGEHEQKRLSRIALSELTDDQLADIGVTPSQARREAMRPFWS